VKVRFLADADLNKIIVTGTLRREPSVDFLTAHMAAGQQRLLVSHDVGTAIDELLLIWLASEASEWENQMVWLPL